MSTYKGLMSVSRYFLTEKIITWITRSLDVWLIGWAFFDPTIGGAVMAFLVVTPVNIILSSVIVIAIEWGERKGYDPAALGDIKIFASRNYLFKEHPIKAISSRILRRIVTSPRLIFWVGSWFYLDPDYVTLLLKDPNKSIWANIVRILVPSTIYQMIIWVPLFWIAVIGLSHGYTWLGYFVME